MISTDINPYKTRNSYVRLTRFGFKTLAELLGAFGVEIVVLNHEDKDPKEELVEDCVTGD